MSTDGNRAGRPPLRTGMTAAAAVLALAAAGCAGSHTARSPAGPARDAAVTIDLTPQGCAPRPARIPAGQVAFKINNKNAGAVSEAELRTADLAHILGEQEDLTPGLSGGFALNLQPGRYTINCPGAGQPHWTLTVAGKAAGASWPHNAQLTAAVTGTAQYNPLEMASGATDLINEAATSKISGHPPHRQRRVRLPAGHPSRPALGRQPVRPN